MGWNVTYALSELAARETKDGIIGALHEREVEIFEKLGYIDHQYLADRIRGDVLMFVGLMDTICPPSTQFATYNKITANKQLAIYPDFGMRTCQDQRIERSNSS